MNVCDQRRLPQVLTIVQDQPTKTWRAAEPDSAKSAVDPSPFFRGDTRQDVERMLTYAGYKAKGRRNWERIPDAPRK